MREASGPDRASDGAPRFSAEPSPERAADPAATNDAEGGVFFEGADAAVSRARMARERGSLVVWLDAAAAKNLLEAIDEAVESALAHAEGEAGQSPLAPGAASDADSALSDQLYRARRLGKAGLCLVIEGLRARADERAVLTANDSAVLRFFARATRERPLELVIVDADALGGYAAPAPLLRLLTPPPSEPRPGRPVESPERRHAAAPPRETPAPIAQREPTPAPRESFDSVRAHVAALTAAKGPQTLAAFERLFCNHYVPLDHALARGLDDARAEQAHRAFRDAFARAYGEALPTFALTAKRPKLVLDVFDLAAKCARLHGARAVHVVLADGLRWDVGVRVRDELAKSFGDRASLADELLLFAALPTTTARQLDALARGLEALRMPYRGDDPDALRGRTADVVRRVKVGSRDVFKVDLVETRLREAGQEARAAAAKLSPELASVIAKHAASLPPRTLLFVLGDHGFTFAEDGTFEQGGASPEEVLVPAFAFLLGEPH
jgi:hypothetical protein